MQIYIQIKIENIFNLNDNETMKFISSLWESERCTWCRWGGGTMLMSNIRKAVQHGRLLHWRTSPASERPFISVSVALWLLMSIKLNVQSGKLQAFTPQRHLLWVEGRDRCHRAENYPVLAQQIAHALLEDEGLDEQVYVADDETEVTGGLRRLATRHGAEWVGLPTI